MIFKNHDIRFNNIGYWPKKIRIAALCFITLLSFLIASIGFILPSFQHLKQLQQKESDLKNMLAKEQPIAANIKAYQAQVSSINEGLKILTEQIPSHPKLADLIHTISSQGHAQGIFFVSIEPEPERKEKAYQSIPLQLNVIGNYAAIALFIQDIFNSPRLVTLEDFTLQKNDDKRFEKSALQFRFTLESYYAIS